MPPRNEELKALEETVSSLEEQVLSLQEQLKSLSVPNTLTEQPSKELEDKVWEAVLMGAVSTLFDPSRLCLNDRPKALQQHLDRALRTADQAILVARSYKAHLAKEAEQRNRDKENDILKKLKED